MNYTETMKKTLGENIWRRRELLGMSREELGTKLGVGKKNVSNWESGKTVPVKDRLREMSKIFGCSINDLHRAYRMPVLSVRNGSIKEVVTDEPNQTPEIPYIDDEKGKLKKLSNRLNRYFERTNTTAKVFCKNNGLQPSMISKLRNNKCKYYTDGIKRIEEVLDKWENYVKDKETKKEEYWKNSPTSEGDIIRIIAGVPEEPNKQPEPVKEEKPVEKGSISDRLNALSDTLLTSLAELDEIRAEVDKLSKISALLKEIQGL